MANEPASPVDREARALAAEVLARFRDGELTNDAFEDAYPASDDPALAEIARHVWFLYDDLSTHRLTGLSPEVRAELDRCVLFLRSGLTYEWPRIRGVRFLPLTLLNLLSLGLAGWAWRRWFEAQGEAAVWPFKRRADLVAAQR